MKKKMGKYRVDYMDSDGEIITIEIEARSVVKTNSLLVFLDKNGEGDYVFLKKGVICYEKTN